MPGVSGGGGGGGGSGGGIFACQFENPYGSAFSMSLTPPPPLKNSRFRRCKDHSSLMSP